MNTDDDNITNSGNDDLDDLLKALNDDSVSTSKSSESQPKNEPKGEDDGDLDRLRGLFSNDEPVSPPDSFSIQDSDQIIDLSDSDILVPSFPDTDQDFEVFTETTTSQKPALDEDLDARLRDLITETTPDAQAEELPYPQDLGSEMATVVISNENTSSADQNPDVTEPKLENEFEAAKQEDKHRKPKEKKTLEAEEVDLEDLKQHIHFDDKKAPPSDHSLMGRLNSDRVKDPLVITVYAFLIIILLTLLGFISITVANSPAWHPTPTPSPTPMLDTKESYIIGLKFGSQAIEIKPVAGDFSAWEPDSNQALVIEGSYFCRLVYVKNASDVFNDINLKIGYVFYIPYSGENSSLATYHVTSIDSSTFPEFKDYSNKQRDCVAIFLDSTNQVIVAERVR